MKGMHRKLTDSAMASSGGLLATLAPSAKMRENQEKERVEKDHDPEAAIESDSSDEQTEEEDDDDKPSPVHAVKSSFVPSRPPMSLAAAAENERLDIIRDHTHNTLSRQKLGGNVPTIVKDNSLAATRKKQIRPNTSFTDDSRAVSIQNSDEDAEELARGDRDLTIIESRRAEAEGRLFCTLQRGDYEACFQKAKRTRQYLIAVDLSPQAKYAIEWAIGTVVRDGDTVRIVHVLDLDDKEDRRSEAQQAEQRGASMDDILVDLKRFLMRTKLEVRCEVEVIHHVAPKHLITEIIDTMDPTLVVIGSRGLGNMTGILLGSFSNYIINKSSAPVMVARKRLRRGGSKKRKIVLPTTMRMVNNRFETAVVD
jgi:nucleotide-binding universal stress UspA family protein